MKQPVKPPNSESAPKKPAAAKLLLWASRLAIGALCLLLAAMAAIYFYLERDPQKLADQYLSEISKKTGLQFSIGEVEVTLLPLPAIALSNVGIIGDNVNIHIVWAQMAPSFFHIFEGDFFPGTITILRPRVLLETELPLDEPGKFLQNLPKSDNHLSLPGTDLEILDLDASITGADGARIMLTGLDSRTRSWRDGSIAGELRFSGLSYWKDRQRIISMDKFSIYGSTNFKDFKNDTPGLHVNGRIRWQGVLAESAIGFEMESSPLGWSGKGRWAGHFDLSGEAVPFSFMGRLACIEPMHSIVARGLDWQMDADSGSLDLTFRPPDPDGKFMIQGTFMANRLSLPQWLGFARNLPPGLQLSLDNIYNTRAEFLLNNKGLAVSKVRACCVGSAFIGKGGVPDWKKPSVNLDLIADSVNLGRGLAESLGQSPMPPHYPFPPLTPMTGKPLEPGETGIDYDIRLAAKTLVYGPLKMQNASLRIHPGKMDVSRLQDVLLDGKSILYGGKLTGSCILGADPSLPIHISGKADNVNGASLGKALAKLPIRQGNYDASATVTSRGKKLNAFLANLRGDIQISGQNAQLSAAKFIFENMGGKGAIRGAAWNGKDLTFDGLWKIDAKCKDWSGNGNLDGKLAFSEKGLNFSNLQASFSGVSHNGLLPKDVRLKLAGRLSGNTGQNHYRVEKYKLELADAAATGNVVIDGAKTTAQGDFAARMANPAATLQRLGFGNVKIPANFTPINIEGDFLAQENFIKLSKLKGSFAKNSFSGQLQWEGKNRRPFYNISLNLGKLAFGSFNSSSTPNWNYPFLTKFDAVANLKISELDAFDVRLKNLKLDMNLKNGILAIKPLTANFYGAPLKVAGQLDFHKGIVFDAHTQVYAFDLGAAVRDRKAGISLSGAASLEATLKGQLTGKKKLIEALNGPWQLAINNGAWQSLDKNGNAKGEATTFTSISASGSLNAGKASSSNFVLKSPSLTVSGGGWLNLASKKMDCTFNVNMKGVPDFPLYVYGPLGNLQKRIGAGKMIMNAVGGVAGGFVNAIGGALKGAWNVFAK